MALESSGKPKIEINGLGDSTQSKICESEYDEEKNWTKAKF